MSKLGLYLHFPFCRQKCHYCSLFSQAGLEKLIPEYVLALKHDLLSYQAVLADQEVASIYFGGGTPSLMSEQDTKELLNLIRDWFDVSVEAEVSIEANPDTLSLARLQAYREMGINRLSLGLQAWQDQLLVKMGRQTNQLQFVQALTWAKQVGFSNINADLIFGLPDQTLTDWIESLEAVIQANLQHVSCYSLEIDERSTWGRLAAVGKFTTAPEELDRAMAELAKTKLAAVGLHQYEISNFARSGFECQHNLNFWRGQSYIGLGAGAHSFMQNYRYHNLDSIPHYIQQMTNGDFERKEKILETDRDARDNYVMQRLRLNEGLSLTAFEQRFGEELVDSLVQSLYKLKAKGLIKFEDRIVKLTDLGQSLENQVIVELFS